MDWSLKRVGDEWIDKEGVTWDSRASFVECSILGLCGCGDPGSVREYIRAFMERIMRNEYPEYEDLPAMFLIYWLNEKGWAEHGVSARCSWLSPEGKELLDLLNELEIE